MISKLRLTLGMLVLFALALGAMGLVLAVEADPVWATILPGAVLFLAVPAHSMGWFNKKSSD